MSQNYKKAVAEARRLVKRSEEDQWRLAELTWQQIDAGKTVSQWAEDVGVSRRTAQAWRQIWARWGEQNLHTRPAWAEAYQQVNPTGAKPESVDRAVRNMPPERKAEVARELLADEKVAEHVVEQPETRQSVTRALDQHYDKAARRGTPKLDTARDAHADALALVTRLRAAHRALAEAITLAQNIRGIGADDLRDAVRDEIRWQRMAIDAIEIGAGGGSIDDQYAELLDSEAGR